ncbi:MAG: phosphatidate cytidylyltransferase [Methylacidiphilales bacterium]|nr:phosphatidate cytidylyltransferase [Candidatus Methylacidiphilales bacterium]
MSELAKRIIGAAVFTFIFLLIIYFKSTLLTGLFLLTVLFILLFEVSALVIKNNMQIQSKLFLLFFIYSWITLSVFCIGILLLGNIKQALGLFALTICCDVMSYLGGKSLGRRKLAPFISPGKTVEGAIIGIVSTVVLVTIILMSLNNVAFSYVVMFKVLFLAIIAVVADLLESLLKRMANVKDSGKLFYGHGGFLDRFDSLIIVAPLYFYFFI